MKADRRPIVDALIGDDPDLMRRYQTQGEFRNGLDTAIALLECTIVGLAKAADVAEQHRSRVAQFGWPTVDAAMLADREPPSE